MFLVVRSNDSFNFPLELIKYIVCLFSNGVIPKRPAEYLVPLIQFCSSVSTLYVSFFVGVGELLTQFVTALLEKCWTHKTAH